jgi:hypothetical protein
MSGERYRLTWASSLIIFSNDNVVINKYIHVTCLPPSPGKGMIRLLSSLGEDAGHNSWQDDDVLNILVDNKYCTENCITEFRVRCFTGNADLHFDFVFHIVLLHTQEDQRFATNSMSTEPSVKNNNINILTFSRLEYDRNVIHTS